MKGELLHFHCRYDNIDMRLHTHTLPSSILIVIVLFLTIWFSAAASAESFVMAVHFSNEREVLGKWIDLIYTEAFHRIGLEMEYKEYPYRRGDALTDRGEIAGVLARPGNYAEFHPKLIRVEEPAPVDVLAAFGTDADMQLGGWESLAGTSYNVEYPRGFVLAEMNLPKVLAKEHISATDDFRQSLKKLAARRIDVLLAPESILSQLLDTDEFKDSGIRKVGMMQEVPLYAFLHSKHKDVAVQLAEALKQMKAEGLFDEYYNIAREATKGQ